MIVGDEMHLEGASHLSGKNGSIVNPSNGQVLFLRGLSGSSNTQIMNILLNE